MFERENLLVGIIISRQIFFWIIILFFTSCELKIKEDKDFATPVYRTDRIDSVTVKKYIIKRFFVKNYRYRENKFDSVALDMVCQAINDSIPITNLDFTFLAGTDEMLTEITQSKN